MNFKQLNEAFDRLNKKALTESTNDEGYFASIVRDTLIDAHVDYDSIDVKREGNYILVSVYNELPYTTDDLHNVWLNLHIPEAESCDMLNDDGGVMMFEFSLESDNFEESLSDDIRKGNLDYDDEIDAHYKKNGNVEVQFQDRNSNMHVQRNPKDRFSKFEKQPRVSSHTWGRVWKDGNLVKSVEDSKYGTRQEIAKYLDDNSMGESLKESEDITYTPKVRRFKSVDGSNRIINQYYEEPNYPNWGKAERNVKEISDDEYDRFQQTGKLEEDTSKEWKPNTSFAHIKKVYNDVKNRGYKYVNNELEEMQAAMKKVDAKGYTPEQRKQIRSWHEEIWRAHKKNESLKNRTLKESSDKLIAKCDYGDYVDDVYVKEISDGYWKWYDSMGESDSSYDSPLEAYDEFKKFMEYENPEAVISAVDISESLKESYDDVTSSNAFDVLYDMVELFGCEEMLDALAKAMGTYDLADNLTYICRQYDYDPNSDYVDESLTESTGRKEIEKVRKFTKEFCNGEWSNDYIDLVSDAVLNSDSNYKDIVDTCSYILSAYPGAWGAVEKNNLSDDMLSYHVDKQYDLMFKIFLNDVQDVKIGYYSTEGKNESLTEERGNYGHKGPFWYYSKHGMGPGTIPPDVNVVDWYEDDNYNTWIALDGILTTQELRDYDLKEQKPPQLFMNDLKKSNDSNYKSLVYRYAMMVVNALNDRHDEDLDDSIESIIDAMITNDEAYIILVHFNSDGYSVKSVEPEMWEEFHNDIKLAVENLS